MQEKEEMKTKKSQTCVSLQNPTNNISISSSTTLTTHLICGLDVHAEHQMTSTTVLIHVSGGLAAIAISKR